MYSRIAFLFIAASCCIVAACRQAPSSALAMPSTDEAAARKAPPNASRCDSYPHRGVYWIKIAGDGDEQIFREGIPIVETGDRTCGPSGQASDGRLLASACAARTTEKRSCIFINAPRAEYFDRQGTRHLLTVERSAPVPTEDGVDGTLVLSGGSQPLRVELHLRKDSWLERGGVD
jgi:hypothetical protein